MLSTLLGIPKDLGWVHIGPIQFLRDLLPLPYLIPIGSLPGRAFQAYQSLLDDPCKQV